MSKPFVIFCRSFGPYHIARLRAAAAEIPGIVAVEFAVQELKYPWVPDRKKLPFELRTFFNRPFETLTFRELRRKADEFLEELRPSIVMVVGYADRIMRYIAAWAKTHSVPCIMTTDTTGRDRPRYWVKELLKRWWCRRYFDALFIPGERSAAYFVGLGFPEDRIWRGLHVADEAFFCTQSTKARNQGSHAWRSLSLPDRYFLTVARLSPEKNLRGLLGAFSEYRKRGGPWDLVIIGSGPQEEALRVFIHQHSIAGVHLLIWKQLDELPPYFGLASCFVLPSMSEPWGIVVNEALACGLPVLVSRQCGCQPELCRRGINGYDFDPHDTDELARLMLRFSSGELDLKRMGQASRSIAANFTLETWTLALKDCVAGILGSTATSVAFPK
ncbi:MAG TPA: glycosyltransferase family 4 protein [Desulfomonilaceae bacterium]|nr:glycosyltransferase family 4 protein [Desulfomonilaceae bacterium]